MPKKIRELKAMLLKAGFSYRSGKGSHTVWNHALFYQEKDVKKALQDLDNLKKEAQEEE